MSELQTCLVQFKDKVNGHPRMRTLLKGWDRVAGVTATDTGAVFTVTFRDSQIVDVQQGGAERERELQIEATEALLVGVFSGATNPASEFLEGRLQVFASDKDQVKLDAITLVLWD